MAYHKQTEMYEIVRLQKRFYLRNAKCGVKINARMVDVSGKPCSSIGVTNGKEKWIADEMHESIMQKTRTAEMVPIYRVRSTEMFVRRCFKMH